MTLSFPRLFCTAALLAVPLAVTACSTGGQHLTKTGFLSPAPKLEKEPGKKNVAVWTAAGFDPSRYDAVIIAPVAWDAPPRGAEVQAKLQAQFRDSLAEQLATKYRIVNANRATGSTLPGPTLRVRAAITNVRRTRWYLNAPVQAATFALGGIGLFGPLQGGASEEIQIEDARSGAVLFQMATYRNGKPWNMKGSYVAYDHARMAFREASRHLAEALQPGAKP